MAWRIVVQPNALYARFADPVDNFTHVDMTRAECFDLCLNYMGRKDAEEKIRNAELELDPWTLAPQEPLYRWNESLETIRSIHGEEEYQAVAAMNWKVAKVDSA